MKDDHRSGRPNPDVAQRKAFSRREALIVCVVVVVALGAYLVARTPLQSAASQGGPYAVVQTAEGFHQALPLNQDATALVETSAGSNLVCVEGGAVHVDEADCKNQVCVDTGAVNRPGDLIVCLPHQLVVQVVEDPSQAGPVQGFLG